MTPLDADERLVTAAGTHACNDVLARFAKLAADAEIHPSWGLHAPQRAPRTSAQAEAPANPTLAGPSLTASQLDDIFCGANEDEACAHPSTVQEEAQPGSST